MSETTVDIHEAKMHLPELIERALAGETILIAEAGTPKVMLAPVPAGWPRAPGRFAGKIHLHESAFNPLTEDELREWEEGHPGDPLRNVTLESQPSP